ncbi:MAG: outer membrane beta-barrel protein [Bacteroidia bacterium]
MKRLVVLSVILLFNQTIFGQQYFGIKANGGLSRIYTGGEPTPLYVMPSYQGGLFYNLHLGKKSLLGAELLFMQIEGKEHSITEENPLMLPTGQLITTDTYQHISYLSLPIYYGIKVKRFTFNIGLQTSVVLMSSGEQTVQTKDITSSQIVVSSSTSSYKTNNLPIKQFAFGEVTKITYNLTNTFAIEANYYWGLSNIYKNTSSVYAGITLWRTQQLTIGLRYTFLTLKKKEGKE